MFSDLDSIPADIKKAQKATCLLRPCHRDKDEVRLGVVKGKMSRARENFRVSTGNCLIGIFDYPINAGCHQHAQACLAFTKAKHTTNLEENENTPVCSA